MSKLIELDQIKDLLAMPELIDEVADGFVLYSKGLVNVPPVGFLHFDNPPGDVHIKYGAVTEDDVYVLKVASAFYQIPDHTLPASDGVILVFSQKTGRLKQILHDECWLTDMRTAAAGAVAARHLARRQIDTIGIVGTGVQARAQLEALSHVLSARRCLIWGRSDNHAHAAAEDLRASQAIRQWELSVQVASELEEVTTQSDLIVTTTSATAPLISAVAPGTHITAMGSDDYGKQELAAELVAAADVVVADSLSQCIDHGECREPIQRGLMQQADIVELGQVIAGTAAGRTSDQQITIADLTGVAIQDIQVAKMVSRALDAQS